MNMPYSIFMETHLPIFSGAKDPLDADDRLRTTKSKFDMLHCTEYQKNMYAAHQLRGPRRACWTSFTTALSVDHHVVRDEFCIAFRGHHLSAGTVCCKLVEILELCQGTHSVYDYAHELNNLAQYGCHHVDSDVMKAELYRKGLNI
jgi:hypothetical protein